MSDWVNWNLFAELQKPQQQKQAEQMESRAASEREVMDRALGGLEGRALAQARQGTYKGMAGVDGYADLMRQRDAALQAAPVNQAGAAWESELGGQQRYESPWQQLSKRLGSSNNKLAQRNTQALNQQAYDRQQEEQRRFNEEQKRKLDEAINGKDKREAAQYTAWSDAVQRGAQRNGGIGAGAYYDARDGYGPQPVRQPWGPRVTKMQKDLQDNDKNQLNPPTTNSNFGQSTSGF